MRIELIHRLKIKKTPIQLDATRYFVLVFDSHMKIGCEFHSIDDWFNFNDSKIIEMDGRGALEWWEKWKKPLEDICKAEGRS